MSDRLIPTFVVRRYGAQALERIKALSTDTPPSPPTLCGMRKPGGTTTCIEPAGHAGPDGKGQSHGDGSVIRWIYR